MRPINLIPPEQRRGEHAPLRSGPLAYILVGALVAVLAGVTMLVLAGNQIEERKAEIATLKAEDAAEAARAQRLSAFVQFATMREQRLATVASLADSRFDWERVMRELALILPEDAWLVSLSATAAPGASTGGDGGGSGSGLRGSAPGPALELTGCASGQQAVAGFVGALKDIDGVTRVGVESSELADEAGGGGGSGDSDGDECRTRAFIAKFKIVVAFDAAPVPLVAGSEEAAAAPAETTSSSSDSSEAEESEGG
jgi:Tfp pilus assembly protein PilN